MANSVIMNYYSLYESRLSGRHTFVTNVFPLHQDIQLELTTNSQDLRAFFPNLLTQILDFIKKAGDFVGESNPYLESAMGTPIYDKTDPLKLNLELLFYTKTNPLYDVILPIFDLCSSPLPIRMNDVYMLNPFVNVLNITKSLNALFKATASRARGKGLTKAEKKAESGAIDNILGWAKEKTGKAVGSFKTSKDKDVIRSVDVLIPGVIFVPNAFIMRAVPIFSKETTVSGYPLWGRVNLEIRSLTPADANMLYNSVGAFQIMGLP